MRSTNLFVWMRHFKSIYQRKSNKMNPSTMNAIPMRTHHGQLFVMIEKLLLIFSLSLFACVYAHCTLHSSCVRCLFVIKNLNTCNQCSLLFDTYGSQCYVRLLPFLRSFTSSSIWLIVGSFAFNQNNINNRFAHIPMEESAHCARTEKEMQIYTHHH